MYLGTELEYWNFNENENTQVISSIYLQKQSCLKKKKAFLWKCEMTLNFFTKEGGGEEPILGIRMFWINCPVGSICWF